MKRIAVVVILTAFLTGPALALQGYPKCNLMAIVHLKESRYQMYIGPSEVGGGSLPADEMAFLDGLLAEIMPLRQAHHYDDCEHKMVIAATMICDSFRNLGSRRWDTCQGFSY